MSRGIERRVIRLERDRHFDPPTAILADRPVTEEEAAEALANWRELVFSGRAAISGIALCLTCERDMTEEEWLAECAPDAAARSAG
jgi:hypothetical protein